MRILLIFLYHQPVIFNRGDVIFVQGVLPDHIFGDFELRINPKCPPFSSGDLVYIKVWPVFCQSSRKADFRSCQNADTTWLEQKGSGCWTYAHGSGMGVEGYASGEDDSQGSGDLLGIHEFLMPPQVLSSLSPTFDFSTNLRVFMVLICVDSLFFCLECDSLLCRHVPNVPFPQNELIPIDSLRHPLTLLLSLSESSCHLRSHEWLLLCTI